ncbi:carboxymuconolactone decarboxylase family protein [Dactylosporangium sucinum]|uniref:carboxymuconolactone decarboxylase family protein n=1 Tax=Dactylosporangium sucinum TaxID=1424081 RepID=UPI001E38ABA7
MFSRDNLDWQSREIATVAALTSLDGVESQLRSHFGIALNTGLTATQLRALVTDLTARLGPGPGERAAASLDQVLAQRA